MQLGQAMKREIQNIHQRENRLKLPSKTIAKNILTIGIYLGHACNYNSHAYSKDMPNHKELISLMVKLNA